MILPQNVARAQESVLELADSLDLTQMQTDVAQFLPSFSIRETLFAILRGEMDWNAMKGHVIAAVKSAGVEKTLLAAAAPMCIWCVCAALPEKKGGQLAGRICAAVAACALFDALGRCIKSALSLTKTIALLCENAAPVLATLLSASGGVESAALLTPAASLASAMEADIVCRVTIPAIACAGMLATCPAFSARFSFAGARRLITQACNWTHGLMTAALLGVLTARGLVSTGADSVSMQTARYTVDSLLPVIGGDIADSLGLLVTSAKMVSGALGVTCTLLILVACAGPVFSTAMCCAVLRICRALIEAIDAAEPCALLDAFSQVFSALLVALACASLLFLLLVGAVVSAGRGIG